MIPDPFDLYFYPSCANCGKRDCPVMKSEYRRWHEFWDMWKCDDCHPKPAGRYERFKRHQINSAKICPYCYGKPEYVDSKEIYGVSYGMVYLCRSCDAYVGVHHKNSKKPLGYGSNRRV